VAGGKSVKITNFPYGTVHGETRNGTWIPILAVMSSVPMALKAEGVGEGTVCHGLRHAPSKVTFLTGDNVTVGQEGKQMVTFFMVGWVPPTGKAKAVLYNTQKESMYVIDAHSLKQGTGRWTFESEAGFAEMVQMAVRALARPSLPPRAEPAANPAMEEVQVVDEVVPRTRASGSAPVSDDERKNFQSQVSKLKEQVTKLQAKNGDMSKEEKQNTETIKELSQRVAELEELNLRLERNLAEKEGLLKGKDEVIDNLNRTVATLVHGSGPSRLPPPPPVHSHYRDYDFGGHLSDTPSSSSRRDSYWPGKRNRSPSPDRAPRDYRRY
jgi:hypothetical protein